MLTYSMLVNLDDYIEIPQEDYFKTDHEVETESEISEGCLKMMSKIQKELNKKEDIAFKKLTTGQSKTAKCQSFLEILQLKRKNKIDLSNTYFDIENIIN